MAPLRRKRWRRVAALVMLLCFGLLRLEAALPDWDGEGGAIAVAVAATAGGAMDHGSDHPPGEMPHACHCTHVHDQALAFGPDAWSASVSHAHAIVALIQSITSVEPALSLRPPIV